MLARSADDHFLEITYRESYGSTSNFKLTGDLIMALVLSVIAKNQKLNTCNNIGDPYEK